MTDRTRELAWSAGLLALSLLAGATFGGVWLWLCLALALIAGRHLYHLWHLADLMARGEKVRDPLLGGLWRSVYRSADRLRSRSRKRKRRVSRFLTRFRDAAAALPDATVVIGAEGEIEWLNPAAERFLGLCPRTDIGEPLVGRVRDPGLAEYLADSDLSRWIELRSPVDSSRILWARAVPFGKKHQRLVLARDVTRTRLADDAAEDFVANVSHELRTPLTVISGYIDELSASMTADESDAQALAVMRDQAARMTDLVADLLAYSRMQIQESQGALEPVPVSALLERTVEEARALGAASQHTVNLQADPALEVLGHEKLLRSAFSNLIVNAVRHTPSRTTVVIRWWHDAAGAHLSVQDNGEGIPVRHIPRLTERFYRVDESRSRETGGTGLGLAIVKHVLDWHGAELQIESAPGAGCTFTCHFPAQLVAASVEDESNAAGSS